MDDAAPPMPEAPPLTCLALVAAAGHFSSRARLRGLMEALGAAEVPAAALDACWADVGQAPDVGVGTAVGVALHALAAACPGVEPLTDTRLLDAVEQPEQPLAARLAACGLAPVEVLRRARTLGAETGGAAPYSLASEARLRALCLDLNAAPDGEAEVDAALRRAIPSLEWSTGAAVRRLRADLLAALATARQRERLAARVGRLALLHNSALATVERAHQRLSSASCATENAALLGAVQAAAAGGRAPEELWSSTSEAMAVAARLGLDALNEGALAAHVVALTHAAQDSLDVELHMR